MYVILLFTVFSNIAGGSCYFTKIQSSIYKYQLGTYETPSNIKRTSYSTQKGELDSHAGIVISNILLEIILQSTKEIYMYNLNFTKTVSLLNHIFPTTDVQKKYNGPPKFDAKNFLEVAIS